LSTDVSDLRDTIVPKSDQLNADQLLGGPMVITITEVRAGTGEDQPVSIHYKGDAGRPYKPCKTMRRVLILAWGPDGRQWAGKSLELYNDQAVKFGNMDVGGIRISRMSDIPKTIRVALNATKGKKAMHEIAPLKGPIKSEPAPGPGPKERAAGITKDVKAGAAADAASALAAMPQDQIEAIWGHLDTLTTDALTAAWPA
jgi:hypothetical protein